jgi:hypothetical protein
LGKLLLLKFCCFVAADYNQIINGIAKVKRLLVFNRWGQKVFEKQNIPVNDLSHGWDGRVGGLPTEAAVYVYLATIVCDDGIEFNVKGTVLLIR